MMEMAVGPGGTAPRAAVPGYRVAGKTGTAHKAEAGSYAESKYVSSFVGFGPVSDPRLIVAVMLDEPSGAKYYGGDVSAPVFSSVMGAALRLVSEPPDAPNAHAQAPARPAATEARAPAAGGKADRRPGFPVPRVHPAGPPAQLGVPLLDLTTDSRQ
jgi:cell division protein FtsI (penicillin-binding protein 3)